MENNDNFRLLFDQAPLGYQSLDIDGNFLEVNKKWLDVFGYERREVLGRWFGDFLAPGYKEAFKERFPVFKAQGHIHVEFEMVHKNGNILFIAFEGQIGYNEDGSFKQTHCILEDITEKKINEKTLKDALELLKNAGKIARFGGWNVILSEDRSYWSDEVAAIHEMPAGYCPLVRDGINFYAPEWREKITQVFSDCAQNGTPYDEEMEILTSTGKRVWVRTNGEAVRDSNGVIYKVQGGFQDITDQKQAELALQKSEKHYRDLLVNLEAGIVVHAPDTSVLMNNRRASELLGLTDEQMKGKHAIDPLWKFVNENNKPLSLDEYPVNRMITGRQPIKNQILGIQKPGTYEVVWVSVNGFPVLDKEGEITEIVISFIDITEKKRIEIALQMSLMRLRSVFDQSPAGSVIVGLDKKFQKCNTAFCIFIGYPEDELIGKTIAEITHPEDVNLGMNELKLLVEGKIEIATVEKRYIRKDGSVVWGEISISLARNADNNPLYFLPVILDITERKQAEKKLQESRDYLDKIINTVASPIFVKDDKLKFTLVNKALCALLGLSADKLIGNTGYEHFPVEQNEVFLAKDKEVLNSGKENISEEFLTDGNGDIRSIITRKTLYTDLEGNKFIVGIINDVTERIKLEDELVKQNDYIKMILDNFPIGIATNEIDSGKVTYINRKFSEIYGWPKEEFAYINFFFEKVFPDMEYRQLLQTKILADLSSGDIERMNWDNLKITTKAGEHRIVNAVNIPLKDQNIMVSTVQDITKRKKAEDEFKNKVDELNQTISLMVGREIRMIELKKEVNELLKASEKPEKYEI